MSISKPFNSPNSKEQWLTADIHFAATVVSAVFSASTVDQKHQSLCSGIYSYFSRVCGTSSSKPSRRQRSKQSQSQSNSISELRMERNKARQQLRKAKRSSSDPQVIRDLSNTFHRSLRQYSRARKAEKSSLQQSNQLKARKDCSQNFWKFAAKTLDNSNDSIQPSFDESTADEFFRASYSSEPKVFHQPSWLPPASPPQVPFNYDDIITAEIQRVIIKSKTKFSPSPIDQISHEVFKKCPSLALALSDLFSLCWKLGQVPSGWKCAAIRLIPKANASNDPANPSNFCPIALSSCVGKLFIMILKNRWPSFVISNGYLDTSVQKAFLPGVPGCLEQYTKLSAAIADAHKRHRSLTVCWIDLANACGSVHHGLIDYALKHYHAPPYFRQFVSHLYSDLIATITSASWTTQPIPLQVGVYQGHRLSVMVFNTVMATLVDALIVDSSLGYTFSQSSRLVNVLQYADDTCLIADGPASCQRMLERVDVWLEWTG